MCINFVFCCLFHSLPQNQCSGKPDPFDRSIVAQCLRSVISCSFCESGDRLTDYYSLSDKFDRKIFCLIGTIGLSKEMNGVSCFSSNPHEARVQ